jgi:hypothetical protein
MNPKAANPSKEGKYLFWIGVMMVVISPFLVYIPVFGLLFIIPLIIFGFVLIVLGNNIWKEDVRHYRELTGTKPVTTYSRSIDDKIIISIGLILLFAGPLLCYTIYFHIEPRTSYEGYFPLFIVGIAMFPIGMALVFFGITSLERNALLNYNIPEHHFLWMEKEKISRKTIEIAIIMIFIYLIIFLAFIAPIIIQYNEYWADGHSGARSPFGSGGECCSILLLFIFAAIFWVLRTTFLFKLKRDYIKELEKSYRNR